MDDKDQDQNQDNDNDNDNDKDNANDKDNNNDNDNDKDNAKDKDKDNLPEENNVILNDSALEDDFILKDDIVLKNEGLSAALSNEEILHSDESTFINNNQQEPRIIRHYSVRQIILITFLTLLWIIYTVMLTVTPEHQRDYHLVAIMPNDTVQYQLNYSDVQKSVGIQMIGPFVSEQNLMHKPPPSSNNLPQLFCVINIRIQGSEKMAISEPWSVLISEQKHSLFTKLSKQSLEVNLKEDFMSIHEIMNNNIEVYLTMTTNIDTPIAIKLLVNPCPINKFWGVIIGAFILISLYILIIFELINHTLAAFILSIFSIAILASMQNRPDIYEIMEWIDVETLLLLFGMMILVSILAESGVFDYLAVLAYQIAKGNSWTLIVVLCVSVGLLSALLDNVTMMLLLTPVTTRLCEVLNLNPANILMSMVIISNIGAALTPVGDPPNIIITNHIYVIETAKVNFANFIVHMMPGVFTALLTGLLHIRFVYKRKNQFMNKETPEIEAIRHQINVWERAAEHVEPTTNDEETVQNTLRKEVEILKQKLSKLLKDDKPRIMNYEETLAHMKANYPIRNMILLIKATVAFIFVTILFFLHAIPNIRHIPLGWSALIAALFILIIADEENIDEVLGKVEWLTLFFFACLFVLMESLSRLGVIDVIGHYVINIVLMVNKTNQLLVAILLIIWVTGLASAFLNNIPVVTMMVRIVVQLCQNDQLDLPPQPLIWALAFGACFGGNGTLLGASANVVAAGMAEQHGYPFNFIQFFLYAFPITVNSLTVCTIYLLLAHCAFTWH